MNRQRKKTEPSILIIGAGFAGLGAAIRLTQEGFSNVVVLEANEGVGGTWRENTYPGCACDVPSHLYCYSFEPNPNWTRVFSPQPEILAYLEHCADKYDITRRIRFNTRVNEVTYSEADKRWRVGTESGQTFEVDVVLNATGPLNRPKFPAIPGRELFKGDQFHSSRWDHSVDLEGKRIATIGTGASAIQFIPEVVDSAAEVTVFQRTPAWILPRPDRPYSEEEKGKWSDTPLLHRAYRSRLYWILESRAVGFVLQPKLLGWLSRFAKQYLERRVQDEKLREKLTPNYVMGCKRVLFSSKYYRALVKEHVSVETSPIVKIDEKAVYTADGTCHEVDAIIYGTGFKVAEVDNRLTVTGRGGRTLNDVWSQGADTYLGMGIHGFPNYFVMVGPNTGLGHNSIVFMIECQADYIVKCMKLFRRGQTTFEVKQRAQERFVDGVARRMKRTVWSSGCDSWYLDPESGKNFTLWPGFTFEYWLRTRRVDRRAFETMP